MKALSIIYRFLRIALVLLGIVLLARRLHAQEPVGPNDPTLNTIANNVAILDSDLNGWNLYNGQPLTASNLMAYNNSLSNSITTNGLVTSTNVGTAAGLQGTNFSHNIAGAFMSFSNTLASTVNPASGTGADTTIPLGTYNGNVFSMDLGYTSGGYLSVPFATSIRNIIVGIFSAVCFLWGMQAVQTHIQEALNQRQMEGSKQEVFGINISAVSAPVFCGILVVAISTLVPILMSTSFMTTCFGGFSEVLTWFGAASSTIAGYNVITSFCPIGEVLVIWVNYLCFRYIYMYPLFRGVSAIVLWLGA